MLVMTPSSARGLRGICLRSAAWYTGFAVYAACVALFSGPGLDHMWGAWAVGGYAASAAIAAWRPTRRGQYAALTVAVLGSLVAPLVFLAVREPITSDCQVVEMSGRLLLHHGVPYLAPAQLAVKGWLGYNPYLPLMAVFGLPHALAAAPPSRSAALLWLALAPTFLGYLTWNLAIHRASVSRVSSFVYCSTPLAVLIARHEAWVASEGREGRQLDLSGFDLRTAPPLAGAQLAALKARAAEIGRRSAVADDTRSP